MQDGKKPGRARDPVDEAVAASFPASDPPAWTAVRTGRPEGPATKEARRAVDLSPPRYCEVTGLFRPGSDANTAANALLTSGFNLVDIGPPRGAEPDWPPNGVLLRIKLKSADDLKRALAILEAQGACKLHVSWQQSG